MTEKKYLMVTAIIVVKKGQRVEQKIKKSKMKMQKRLLIMMMMTI